MVTEKISLGAKEVCRLADEKDVKERTMKVTHKGPADADRFQLVPNTSAVGGVRRDKGARVGQTGESSIFKEARESQRIAELARQGDELRAEKVKRVKEMMAKGKYEIDAKEVAKSILRAQPARRSGQNFYTASAGRTQSWIDGKSAGAHPRGAHAGFRVPLR
jgi:anti-sigma28 factor (negative regulator of flagellin synthesis)